MFFRELKLAIQNRFEIDEVQAMSVINKIVDNQLSDDHIQQELALGYIAFVLGSKRYKKTLRNLNDGFFEVVSIDFKNEFIECLNDFESLQDEYDCSLVIVDKEMINYYINIIHNEFKIKEEK
ncbi:Uncharacterised protein [Vibrio cholerae]|nr:Uncharacterised protein [Vibrio cholerae]